MLKGSNEWMNEWVALNQGSQTPRVKYHFEDQVIKHNIHDSHSRDRNCKHQEFLCFLFKMLSQWRSANSIGMSLGTVCIWQQMVQKTCITGVQVLQNYETFEKFCLWKINSFNYKLWKLKMIYRAFFCEPTKRDLEPTLALQFETTAFSGSVKIICPFLFTC